MKLFNDFNVSKCHKSANEVAQDYIQGREASYSIYPGVLQRLYISVISVSPSSYILSAEIKRANYTSAHIFLLVPLFVTACVTIVCYVPTCTGAFGGWFSTTPLQSSNGFKFGWSSLQMDSNLAGLLCKWIQPRLSY